MLPGFIPWRGLDNDSILAAAALVGYSYPMGTAPALQWVRQRASAAVGQGVLAGVARVASMHPKANPRRHGVEVIGDVPYVQGGRADHTLDIYRPTERHGPLPICLYVHGGGFSLLSKDTHWVMALAYARFGYLVVNISYRLAPKHPYPAAIEDTCAAYGWLVAEAESYGGDLRRVVCAGESAGANLVTALAIASCYRRPEPWARGVFETEVVPRAIVPACGLLQVSNPGRFTQRRHLPFWVSNALTDVSDAYLEAGVDIMPGALDMADPLVVLERGEAPARPLPSFFVPVGTRDPLLDDTRRLKTALDALGVPCTAAFYEREVHAFHAMVWREQARRCWLDTHAFLERELRPFARSARSAAL